MSEKQKLREIAESAPGWAKSRALIALDIIDQHEQGNLSEDEMKELMEDLVRTDKLDAEADDIELKAALVTAIMIVSKVA